MSDPLTPARKLFGGPCEFVWGARSVDGLPPQRLPEAAFAGRSNVGKSSLINAITNRKGLARASQTPGRTREINFFDLSGRLTLVDLPGYGYAKASRKLAAEWQNLAIDYLRGRASLRRVVLLLDARRGVMDVDRAVMDILDQAAVSYCLTLTKTDLAPAKEAMEAVEAEVRRHTAAFPEVFATSAHKAAGLDALRLHLVALAAR